VRSLFLRLFLSFWVAMMVISAAFAVIYTFGIPELKLQRYQRLVAQAVQLRGEQAVRCLETRPRADCAAELPELAAATGIDIAVLRGDEVLLGSPPDEEAQGLLSELTAGGEVVRRASSRRAMVALEVSSQGGDSYRVVGARARTPRWLKFIAPETLPQRLAVLLLVTGLVSLLLARYLSRPLRTLRRATHRIAEGDLSVRVTPELTPSDRETAALAHDFDRMAERIETVLESQRQLMRDVSHELRSPLARLNVALELARQRAGPDAERALDRIELEAERLNELVGQVLTVARLDADATPQGVSDVALGSLVEEVARDVEFEARSRGRRVELADLAPATIAGNEVVLRRAIENVLRNAVLYTADETAVEVKLVDDGESVELEVRDHGPGVPDEALADIFRPFYRVGDDRGRGTGGTGVGLAIAQRAVAWHGGTVTARNAPEGGLSVSIRLPLRGEARA
jgi:two-component system sensor histidine kinase CpxA